MNDDDVPDLRGEYLLQALKKLLYGSEMSGREASEIVALVVQNTKRWKEKEER